jgi:hypothetical protein
MTYCGNYDTTLLYVIFTVHFCTIDYTELINYYACS